MIINHEKKYLFIHVPRTGGTSLKDALILRDNGKEFLKPHGRAVEARENLGGEWDEYFRFAFVRNPYDWVLSLYCHIIGDPLHTHHETVRGMGFRDYLEWRWKFDRRGQWWHLSDEHGGALIMNWIGRFERYDDCIRELNAELDMDLRPERRNATSHHAWDKVYDDRMSNLVDEAFAKDFKWFGYRNLRRIRAAK